MNTDERLKDIAVFLLEYANRLMGSGVHTSRVVRNTRRIACSMDVDVHMSILQRTIVLSVCDNRTGKVFNEVGTIPAFPISFALNAELSALSWEAYDRKLPLEEIWQKYRQIVGRPRINPVCVLGLVAAANAAFCALLGGDWKACAIVFLATLVGFKLRQFMQGKGQNHYIVTVAVAFVASLVASVSLMFDTTAETAIATSVLFLVPGVPLLNGVIDILEGHVLTGSSRLIQALLLVLCIAVGLSCTLMLMKNDLL